jgi:hypothetical protein
MLIYFSQKLAFGPHFMPVESSPQTSHTFSVTSILILSLQLRLDFSSDLWSLRTNIYIRSKYPTHLSCFCQSSDVKRVQITSKLMEQSSRSASQGILRLLWNQNPHPWPGFNQRRIRTSVRLLWNVMKLRASNNWGYCFDNLNNY